MNTDSLDDKIVCAEIAILIAKEIAAEIRDADPMYMPWGGCFERKVYAVEVGHC